MSEMVYSSMFARMVCFLALVAVVVRTPPAHAEVGSDRHPLGFLTPGPSLEMSLDGSLRFGGEVALTEYAGRWAGGAAFGFVSGRLYMEAQPALVIGDRHNLVLGLNPGLVIDVTSTLPRYGGQATLWASYVHDGLSRWALPVLPFVRAQVVPGMGLVFSGGIMVKLPVPVS